MSVGEGMRGHALLVQWLDKGHLKYNDLKLIVSSAKKMYILKILMIIIGPD